MKRYDSTIFRLQFIISVITVTFILILALIVPDYMRSKQCTESSVATVIDVKVNKIGIREISYNYTLRLSDVHGHLHTVHINNCMSKYLVSDTVTVRYSSACTIWRIPNMFY